MSLSLRVSLGSFFGPLRTAAPVRRLLARSPGIVNKFFFQSPGALLQRALQNRATLALAFCNAHQVASDNLQALERDCLSHFMTDFDEPTALERKSISNSVTEEVCTSRQAHAFLSIDVFTACHLIVESLKAIAMTYIIQL